MSPTGHYASLSSYTLVLPTCCLSYLSFSAEGLQAPLLFLFGVLFGGWSAQTITYLSFSADGLQSSPTCPFRRMVSNTYLLLVPGFDTSLLLVLPSRQLVYTGLTHGLHLHISYFSAQGLQRFPTSSASFSADGRHIVSADGLHRLSYLSVRRMVCRSLLRVLHCTLFTRRAPMTHHWHRTTLCCIIDRVRSGPTHGGGGHSMV